MEISENQKEKKPVINSGINEGIIIKDKKEKENLDGIKIPEDTKEGGSPHKLVIKDANTPEDKKQTNEIQENIPSNNKVDINYGNLESQASADILTLQISPNEKVQKPVNDLDNRLAYINELRTKFLHQIKENDQSEEITLFDEICCRIVYSIFFILFILMLLMGGVGYFFIKCGGLARIRLIYEKVKREIFIELEQFNGCCWCTTPIISIKKNIDEIISFDIVNIVAQDGRNVPSINIVYTNGTNEYIPFKENDQAKKANIFIGYLLLKYTNREFNL